MSTRSLTRIINWQGLELCCIFKQFDGYPQGYGLELAKFLDGFKIVSGLNSQDQGKIANGVACLAAQIIKKFKDGPGHVYVYPPGTNDMGEEYVYLVREEIGSVVMTALAGDKQLFHGGPDGFKFLKGRVELEE